MVETLANFFARHVGSEYISHGEIQTGRAPSPGRFSPDLVGVLMQELGAALDSAQAVRVATLHNDGSLAGLGIVSVHGDSVLNYAILQDLVVARDARGRGLGSALLAWIEARLREHGVRRVFLESGVSNHRAHEFFEARDFRACSLTMMKELDHGGSDRPP